MQPASANTATSSTRCLKDIAKSERRATRLKAARPELARLVGKTISRPEAVKIGGYQDATAMEKDIQHRKLATNKNNLN